MRRADIRSLATVAAVLLGSFAIGCGGPMSAGESEFRQGQYPAAKQTLGALEAESRAWDDPSRAEYALYRGLTLAALGDRGAAAWWLREAKALEYAHPGSLSSQDADRLAVSSHSNALP
jgi:hypothetical protein